MLALHFTKFRRFFYSTCRAFSLITNVAWKHLLPRKTCARATRSTILNYQRENSSLHNENGYPHECNMNIFYVKRTPTFVLSSATWHDMTWRYITLHLHYKIYSYLFNKCTQVNAWKYEGFHQKYFIKKPHFYSTEAIYSQVVLRPYPQEAIHLGQLWIKL